MLTSSAKAAQSQVVLGYSAPTSVGIVFESRQRGSFETRGNDRSRIECKSSSKPEKVSARPVARTAHSSLCRARAFLIVCGSVTIRTQRLDCILNHDAIRRAERPASLMALAGLPPVLSTAATTSWHIAPRPRPDNFRVAFFNTNVRYSIQERYGPPNCACEVKRVLNCPRQLFRRDHPTEQAQSRIHASLPVVRA
jgi:hypothetical protein